MADPEDWGPYHRRLAGVGVGLMLAAGAFGGYVFALFLHAW